MPIVTRRRLPRRFMSSDDGGLAPQGEVSLAGDSWRARVLQRLAEEHACDPGALCCRLTQRAWSRCRVQDRALQDFAPCPALRIEDRNALGVGVDIPVLDDPAGSLACDGAIDHDDCTVALVSPGFGLQSHACGGLVPAWIGMRSLRRCTNVRHSDTEHTRCGACEEVSAIDVHERVQ